MKESEINIKINQTLNEFDQLEDIQPSQNWTNSLMARIASSDIHPASGRPITKVALVLLVFILANVGIILSAISGSNRQTFHRESDLRTISSEFLINPTSISE